MAMDERFFRHFAIVPKADWSDSIKSVPEFLGEETGAMTDVVPSITLTDAEGCLRRAVTDRRALLEARRCRAMWRSLQELGGIRNSHAERLLAQERENAAAAPVPEPVAPAPAPPVASPEQAAEAAASDEPYIETARCTTCNECIRINAKMFAYNENKQAYIADADAGTYRQLVEAAEGCQVGIIHPGKPRNPKEPGLDDLIRRAAELQ
jgi:hypothetical protein